MLVWQGVIDGNQQKFWTKMFCEMALFKAVICVEKAVYADEIGPCIHHIAPFRKYEQHLNLY